MTIAEAVAYLAERGVVRHPRTIRTWIELGYLPAMKIEGRLQVLEADLLLAERDVRRRTRENRQGV